MKSLPLYVRFYEDGLLHSTPGALLRPPRLALFFQLKPAGTACREPSNSCDLPEFCSGASPHCPANVYLHDGHPCQGVDGYCFNGICQTHEQQCVTLWGPGTRCHQLGSEWGAEELARCHWKHHPWGTRSNGGTGSLAGLGPALGNSVRSSERCVSASYVRHESQGQASHDP